MTTNLNLDKEALDQAAAQCDHLVDVYCKLDEQKRKIRKQQPLTAAAGGNIAVLNESVNATFAHVHERLSSLANLGYARIWLHLNYATSRMVAVPRLWYTSERFLVRGRRDRISASEARPLTRQAAASLDQLRQLLEHIDDELEMIKRFLSSLEQIREAELRRRPPHTSFEDYLGGLGSEQFAALKHVVYDEGQERSDNDVCPVCLSGRLRGQTVVILLCGHRYHEWCAGEALQRDVRCPCCRRPCCPGD